MGLNTRNASSTKDVKFICLHTIKFKISQSLEQGLVILELISESSGASYSLHGNKMIKNLLLGKKCLPVTCVIKVLIEFLCCTEVALATSDVHFLLCDETRCLVPIIVSTST